MSGTPRADTAALLGDQRTRRVSLLSDAIVCIFYELLEALESKNKDRLACVLCPERLEEGVEYWGRR